MGPKNIFLCADDFGLHPAIDEGILDLAKKGRLSAASCMTLAPSFQSSAHALAGKPIQIGLHLNLTEGEGSLSDRLSSVIVQTYFRSIDERALSATISRQLDAFEDAFNRAPDYVDGHQHVHQLPIVRDCLHQQLAQRYSASPPWLRGTRFANIPGSPLTQKTKSMIIAVLGDKQARRSAHDCKLHMSSRLLGVYGFDASAEHYLSLLECWCLNALPGDLLMCHPASQEIPEDAIGYQRAIEYKTLVSDGFSSMLARHSLAIQQRPPVQELPVAPAP